MKLQRFALWLFVVIATGWLMIVGRNLILPIVLAIVFWYLINTLAVTLGKISWGGWHLPRSVALPIAILAIGGLFWLLGSMISSNIAQVIKAAPAYQARLEAIIIDVSLKLGFENAPNLSELFRSFDLGRTLQELGGAAASVAGSIGIVIIYTLFLLAEQATFSAKIEAVFHDKPREAQARRLLDHIAEDIQIYIRIKTLLALITAAIGYAIMASVGVDFAGFWAVLIFFFYYIPTIGSLLAIVSPTLLTLVQFDSIQPFIIVAVCMGVVQISMANFIEPMIMGRSLNVSPFIIILSLMVFGTMWGVVGMFLCVPIMVIAMIVLANFPQTRPLAAIISADGKLLLPEHREAKRKA